MRFILATGLILGLFCTKAFAVTDSDWGYCDNVTPSPQAKAYTPGPFGYGKVPKPSADAVCQLHSWGDSPSTAMNPDQIRCLNAQRRECKSTQSQGSHGDHNVPSGAWFLAPGDLRCHCG